MGALSGLLGKRVYLDANVFIYALNGFPPFRPFLEELFDAGDAQSISVLTSELTMAENLVEPFRGGDSGKEQQCRRMLKPDQGLVLQPVTMPADTGAGRPSAGVQSGPAPARRHPPRHGD